MHRKETKITSSPLILQGLIALALGVFLCLLFYLLAILGFQIWYAGRIFPNISVTGIKLGGLTTQDAVKKLNAEFDTFCNENITLRAGEQSWEVPPLELGIRFSSSATAENAFRLGRSAPLSQWIIDQLTLWGSSRSAAPVFVIDQTTAQQYLLSLSGQINQPTIEAGIELQGTQVIATRGQIGHSLDIATTLELITEYVSKMQAVELALMVHESPPEILDSSSYAHLAQDVLGQALSLTMPENQEDENGPWIFEPKILAPMLRFEKIQTGQGFEIITIIDEEILTNFLSDLAPKVAKQPENPRYIFNDETRSLELLQPGITGRNLDIPASMVLIQEKTSQGVHTIPLVFVYTPPELPGTSSAEQLWISELIHAESTYFYVSSQSRIHNIEISANRFHGLLVAPGETLSMASAMGEVSLDSGYDEALIIYNGRTIKGVGGGVCQVSTTLFRTAFFHGFPIIERHPHAYRVSYYEKIQGNYRDPNLAGLDATVYVPLVDLRFTNDTPYWLLMETYVNRQASRLTWKFYSTSDGRSVDWQTSGPINIVEPPKPYYKVNPELEQGEIKQVDWEAEGADVQVKRWVYRDGELYFEDDFFTHYEPWRAVYEYGPGTTGIPEQEEEP